MLFLCYKTKLSVNTLVTSKINKGLSRQHTSRVVTAFTAGKKGQKINKIKVTISIKTSIFVKPSTALKPPLPHVCLPDQTLVLVRTLVLRSTNAPLANSPVLVAVLNYYGTIMLGSPPKEFKASDCLMVR